MDERRKDMMKVFICPECGGMTAVSRRKQLFCHKCSGVQMVSPRLTYSKYIEMDGRQRKDYAESWLYIRKHTGNH